MFQSTRLRLGATISAGTVVCRPGRFQSTRLRLGATRRAAMMGRVFGVSIHAPAIRRDIASTNTALM